MILTTKGRYAVMAMVDIAINQASKPVSLSDISMRQEIDLGYLEQIFAKLKKYGLVDSVRGPGGGYKLSRQKHEITISDIMLAVDENMKMTRCENGSSAGCLNGKARCATHHLWDELGSRIGNYLESVNLDDVLSKCVGKVFTQMRVIS